jgi:transcriptional regulator with XRE-family HTH domain
MELRIKEIQKKKGITNVELSRLTGIGVQQIAYYHSGFRKPPLSSLDKIASALNCEPVELIVLSSENFYHKYDENGNWTGVEKKIK